MAKERSNVALEDQWNVAALYPNVLAWEKEYAALVPESPKDGSPRWPKIAALKGTLDKSPSNLKNALDAVLDLSRKLTTLYTYAHLRHDEDIAANTNKTNYNRILGALHDLGQETSWFDPELLAISDEKMKEYLSSPILSDYKFHIEKSVRVKKHMLSHQGEELLAMAAKALQSPHKAFSAINDADFKFGKVADEAGKEHDLSHASYGIYIRMQDRTLRKNTFDKLHGKYRDYENTLCELLNGEVQGHIFNAKARHYKSSLEAALYPKNIDVEVYYALIKAVNDNLKASMHKYVALRAKMMGISHLHPYDMYVPLTKAVDIKMSYSEAEDIVIESVAPLGSEYQSLLKKGFKEDRWVDRYENQNKRSGAYSSGCYDSSPFILMNYKGILKDVFTLAHEAGHSMHSLYTHKHQPYQYGDYPIFLAEVASTFNEELLMRLMLDRVKSKEERIYLINEKIEDIRGTLFRQTMFAEFELWIHEMAEQNIPLTPKLLSDQYLELNRKYFGDHVILDEYAAAEWSRIPHFYYNFYVFQYATGISAALALADRVLSGGVKERDEYLSFLKSGCSHYPIETLKAAGVDMRSPEPVAAAIKKFSKLVDLLAKELES